MMLYQTDDGMDPRIKKDGCYLMSIAYFRHAYQGQPFSIPEINLICRKSIEVGIMSSDLFINDPSGLCLMLGVKLRYIDGHFPIDNSVRVNEFAITAWYNKKTEFTHFVVGSKRPVEYDPIRQPDGSGSITVRDGVPQSLRIYQRI
jgi:hypothetical protein